MENKNKFLIEANRRIVGPFLAITFIMLSLACLLLGPVDRKGQGSRVFLAAILVIIIHVPITTLCPCSKEISAYGAHNQRGEVRLQVRFKKFVWIEDLIKLIERSASSDVYSVLKREDEKFVTEGAYNKPMFVEDIVRDIAVELNNDSNITWFAVESENFESIHNHNAYAYVEKHKEPVGQKFSL
jgi:GTP cyclohydrolase FolE2